MGFSTFHWLVVCPEHVISSELSFPTCKGGRDMKKRRQTTIYHPLLPLKAARRFKEANTSKDVSQQVRGRAGEEKEAEEARAHEMEISQWRSKDHSVQ